MEEEDTRLIVGKDNMHMLMVKNPGSEYRTGEPPGANEHEVFRNVEPAKGKCYAGVSREDRRMTGSQTAGVVSFNQYFAKDSGVFYLGNFIERRDLPRGSHEISGLAYIFRDPITGEDRIISADAGIFFIEIEGEQPVVQAKKRMKTELRSSVAEARSSVAEAKEGSGGKSRRHKKVKKSRRRRRNNTKKKK